MAAVAQLFFLLLGLINNIHAEEFITLREEQDSYTFHPPKEANFCVISRFVGEDTLALWNTSDLWTENSTVPRDLKQRLSVVTRENISSYVIHNLTHSDSGQYQEMCWTEGKVTYVKNTDITICSAVTQTITVVVDDERAVELPCAGAADNLTVQWLKLEMKNERDMWIRDFGNSVMVDSVKGTFQEVKNTSTLHVSDFTVYNLYICLVMSQQQCVSSHLVYVFLQHDIIYRTVGDTAVLQCPLTNLINYQPPFWTKLHLGTLDFTAQEIGQKYSLLFSSLMLNHSGFYSCDIHSIKNVYWLLVCPESGPPPVEFFSEGDEVTLRCTASLKEGDSHLWFRNSGQPSRSFQHFNTSLVISNVSLEDTGEYWCVVIDQDYQCLSTTKIILKYREAFGIYSPFHVVKSSLLGGLLVMLCVVVAVVIQKTKRVEDLSVDTER